MGKDRKNRFGKESTKEGNSLIFGPEGLLTMAVQFCVSTGW